VLDVVDDRGEKMESSWKISFLDFVVVKIGVLGGEMNIPVALAGLEEPIKREEALEEDAGRLFVLEVGGMVSFVSVCSGGVIGCGRSSIFFPSISAVFSSSESSGFDYGCRGRMIRRWALGRF
jgi:hypothetical protein